MLYVTSTTLSVPSLMGAIMAIGVASANSILLVTFAREQQLAGMTAFDAAIAAGRTRIRPVLMTATAMIVGMIPMAIGGAGEEQNAALARAVIGGLLFATPTTLFVVPYLFAVLRKRNDGKPAQGVFAEDPHMNEITPPPQRATPAHEAPGDDVSPAPRTALGRHGRTAGRSWASSCSLLLVGALGYGFWQHYTLHAEVIATAEPAARFRADGPDRGDEGQRCRSASATWPGTTEAFEQANIYARASGYIAKRNVDIGSRVKAGDLLVEIAAPEIEHQIAQAEGTLTQLRANLQQAQANRDLAQVTWDRDQQAGSAGLDHGAAGRHRSPDPAGAGGRGRGRFRQHRRPGGAAAGPQSAEDLSQRGRAVRRRHHPAQYRRRQPGAGGRRQRHVSVPADAQRRDPHPALCAAGRRPRRHAGHAGRRARAGNAGP